MDGIEFSFQPARIQAHGIAQGEIHQRHAAVDDEGLEGVVADQVEGLAGREAAEPRALVEGGEARQVAGALVAEQVVAEQVVADQAVVAEQVVVAEAAVAAKFTQRCRGTSDGRVTTRNVSVPDGAEPLIIQEGGEPARKDDTPAESQGTAPRKHRRPRRELAED